jgi:hypothetical protein
MNVRFQIFAALLALAFVSTAHARWSDIEWVMSLPEPVAKKPATKPAASAAATRPIDDDIGITSTQPATKPELKIPPGKPWTVKVMTKGLEITMLFPDGWEKLEPTEKNPPVIYKRGKEDILNKDKTNQRASWYFLIVETKREKPDKVLGRAIVGRTTANRDFEIREQKAFTLPDGTEAASLLYTARDKAGVLFASRETYRWVSDDHLLITFEWSVVSSWRECHNDMEAITATVKVKTFTPVPATAPASAPAPQSAEIQPK